jgi:hypothetical protein
MLYGAEFSNRDEELMTPEAVIFFPVIEDDTQGCGSEEVLPWED